MKVQGTERGIKVVDIMDFEVLFVVGIRVVVGIMVVNLKGDEVSLSLWGCTTQKREAGRDAGMKLSELGGVGGCAGRKGGGNVPSRSGGTSRLERWVWGEAVEEIDAMRFLRRAGGMGIRRRVGSDGVLWGGWCSGGLSVSGLYSLVRLCRLPQ